jgi:hypothetical protein
MFADAVRLLETANCEGDAELSPSDFAILVDRDGSIRVVDSSGWRTDSLRSEHGAETLFRVSRTSTRVQVEAESGLTRCSLERTKPISRLTNYSF